MRKATSENLREVLMFLYGDKPENQKIRFFLVSVSIRDNSTLKKKVIVESYLTRWAI